MPNCYAPGRRHLSGFLFIAVGFPSLIRIPVNQAFWLSFRRN
jgi:hypothetical protein